jgi:hypothetical protein
MREFVSNGWVRVFAWVASVSVVWAVLAPLGLSLSVFVWASALGFLALVTSALGPGIAPPRSIGDIIGRITAGPILAVATSPAVRAQPKGLAH